MNRYTLSDPGEHADDAAGDFDWQPSTHSMPDSPARTLPGRLAAADARRRMADHVPMSVETEQLLDTSIDRAFVHQSEQRLTTAASSRKRRRHAEDELERIEAEIKARRAELEGLEERIAGTADKAELPICPICLVPGNHMFMTAKQITVPKTGLVALVPTSTARYCDECPTRVNNVDPLTNCHDTVITWVRRL